MKPRDLADKVDWLCLIRSENVGAATFYALVKRFGSAGEALGRLPDLETRRPIQVASPEAVDQELEVAARLGVRHIFLGDPDYPPLLAAIHAPPPVLTVRGDPALLSREAIALVGSRKASAPGRTMTANLATAFGKHSIVVVSGLAVGIDRAGHEASIATGTVAVVAGGVDRPTPAENEDLAAEIAAKGALVSEMPLGTVPVARDYPRRNRIIAGLARAVVVVEAAANSGTLHTARYALNENRDVFAVPGHPLDPRVAGCLALLRDGANLASAPEDVLAVLPGHRQSETGFAERPIAAFDEASEEAPPADAVEAVSRALTITPLPVDLLVRATGLSTADVLAAVVELELIGRADRDSDGAVRLAVR